MSVRTYEELKEGHNRALKVDDAKVLDEVFDTHRSKVPVVSCNRRSAYLSSAHAHVRGVARCAAVSVLLLTSLSVMIGQHSTDEHLSADTVAADSHSSPITGWHELIASVGYGVCYYDGREVSAPYGDNIGPTVAHYMLDYRYGAVSNLAVGIRLQYSPFRYESYPAPGEPLSHFNHAFSVSGLAHIRTSKYRDRESLILHTGLTVSHLRLYEAVLVQRENASGNPPDTVFAPDLAKFGVGVPFALGFESGTIGNAPVRIRLSFEYLIPMTRLIAFAAFPGSIGFGIVW
jgi:hypothetical protein